MKEKAKLNPIENPKKFKKYSVISEAIQKSRNKCIIVDEDMERAMHEAFGKTLKDIRESLL